MRVLQQRNWKPFEGELDEPIRLPARPDFHSLIAYAIGMPAETYEAQEERWAQQCEEIIDEAYRRKINLLFEHYDLKFEDDPDWMTLAISMALHLIRGFEVKEHAKSGPRKSWGAIELARLYFAIEGVLRKRQNSARRQAKSISNAAMILVQLKEFGDDGKDPADQRKNLSNQYHIAKKHPFVQFLIEHPDRRRGPMWERYIGKGSAAWATYSPPDEA